LRLDIGSVVILAIAVIVVWKVVIWFGGKRVKKSDESDPSAH
jgi:membrane protein CcdC involved in cytochrome C biogenesis